MMTRSSRQHEQFEGKLDLKKKLVPICKQLSTQVFFKKFQKKALNTACSFLLDQSGSMTGKRIEETKKLMILLAEVLKGLRIKFEIIGHHMPYTEKIDNMGTFFRRGAIQYEIFKTFEEDWNTVRHRMVDCYATGCNADGEAVMFVYQRLLNRKEQRKILFVLSDGLPSSDGGNAYVDGAYLKRVVEKIAKTPIELYAFGIDTDLPKQFYGENNFVFIKSVLDIGPIFLKELSKILTMGIN